MEEMLVVMKEIRDLLKSIDEKLDGVKVDVNDISYGVYDIRGNGNRDLQDIYNKLYDIQYTR